MFKIVRAPDDAANAERLRRLGDGLRRVHAVTHDEEAVKLAALVRRLAE